ncbi:MAG: hypothetical protein JRD02_04350 [Deltaproteobacteria bacterium]|nr:hypothetical protein [Deltaproteobacteria bacterium]
MSKIPSLAEMEVVKAAAVPAFASYAARSYCRLVGRALRTALRDVLGVFGIVYLLQCFRNTGSKLK